MAPQLFVASRTTRRRAWLKLRNALQQIAVLTCDKRCVPDLLVVYFATHWGKAASPLGLGEVSASLIDGTFCNRPSERAIVPKYNVCLEQRKNVRLLVPLFRERA